MLDVMVTNIHFRDKQKAEMHKPQMPLNLFSHKIHLIQSAELTINISQIRHFQKRTNTKLAIDGTSTDFVFSYKFAVPFIICTLC